MADSEGNALTWRHIGIFRILLRLLAVTVLVMALFALFILFQDLYLSRQQAEWAGGYEEALALRELGEKLRLVEQTASELERIWRNQGHWQAFAEAVFSEQPATNMVGSVEWHLRETSLQVPGQRAKVPMYYYFGQVGGYAPSDRPDELIFDFIERLRAREAVASIFPEYSFKGLQRLDESERIKETRSTYAISLTGHRKRLFLERSRAEP